jgi:hypothetical protein
MFALPTSFQPSVSLYLAKRAKKAVCASYNFKKGGLGRYAQKLR